MYRRNNPVILHVQARAKAKEIFGPDGGSPHASVKRPPVGIPEAFLEVKPDLKSRCFSPSASLTETHQLR